MNLNDWAAVAQIFTSALVVIALPIAIWQVIEANKTRKLQATRELLNEIGTEEVRAARRWVLNQMSELSLDQINQLPEKDIEKAVRVAVSLDRVGYMVNQRACFKFSQKCVDTLT